MKQFSRSLPFVFFLLAFNGCKLNSVQQSLSTNSNSNARFVSGTKAVKIITSNGTGGSYTSFVSGTTATPTATPVPSPYPGYGTGSYLPGVSANQYFDVDGTTSISKPSWLYDVQLGITSSANTSACATFGGSSTYDVTNFYRVSEVNCTNATVAKGTGGGSDPAFIRIILNRDTSVIGSGENLLIQIEYQASGIRLNSDGVSASPEDNVDQLWKVYWGSSLSATSGTPFSTFVPPNYGACASGGTYTTGAPGNCTGTYSGAPTTIKQIIIPLSSLTSAKVIQISRVQGRMNQTTTYFDSPANTKAVNYVSDYFTTTVDCQTDSPLCLGLVVRSITIMRI